MQGSSHSYSLAFSWNLVSQISSTQVGVSQETMLNLIWTAVGVLFILWLLGFSINVGGGLIHILLVLALIGIVYNLFIGRRMG